MLERILVPLDRSQEAERVLPFVELLSRDLAQPLVLLTVIADPGDFSPAVDSHNADCTARRVPPPACP